MADKPPNLREIDCCYNCKSHTTEWGDCSIYCSKYTYPSAGIIPHNTRVSANDICDSHKRE